MSYLQQLVLVDKEESIRSVDFDWRNPYSAPKLSRAVRSNNIKLVKGLLAAQGGEAESVELDGADNRGWTPLHEAATDDKLCPIAQLLIAAGAYIEHKTVDGDTPLLIACKSESEKIVKLLIDSGSAVNTHNNEYLTPLHVACSHKNENIIRLLMNSGADLNAKDDEERSPLYLALENVNTVALKIIIEAGADLTTKDFFSRTPLQYSCMVGNLEIFDMLIDRLGSEKSVINQQTPEGWTLLMEAAQYKNYLIAKKLIDLGADTTLVDNRNLLALHIAAHCERYNLLELFLQNTPRNIIETYSSFGKNMTHYRSLPCLIIDKNEFDSLELLYKFGLSEDVLTCPVQMGYDLLSPISFLLLHADSLSNARKLKFLEFLLNFPFLLDPKYKIRDCYSSKYLMDNEIKVISPIEAALLMHKRTHGNTQEGCDCEKFLAMILARGVSPDIVPVNLSECINSMYLFVKTVQLDFFAGIDLLFKYSNKVEPGQVIDMIVKGVTRDLHISSGDDAMLIHLLQKCTDEVNRLYAFVGEKLETEERAPRKQKLKSLSELLKSHFRVPSLKRLGRAAVRRHIRSLPTTSLPLRDFIQTLHLPLYITKYLLYEIDF